LSRGPRSSAASRPRLGAPRWLPLAAAAAIPCLPFLPLLAAGETLWFRDFSLYFVPMKALLVELWRSGQLPLWDPHVRNGLPFLANPQTGVLYPPSLVLVAFGLVPGLTLFLLLHLAAAGAGFYLFARAAGFRPAVATFGGIAFALSGYVASLLNVLNNLQTVAWVPWILAFALRLARRRARGDWFGMVLATALALLGGELQLAALALGLAVALVLVLGEGVPAARPRLRPALLTLVAAAAAAGLVAVQLLPTAELVRESVRHGGLPFALAAEGSLDPASLFSLAFPRPAVPGTAASGPVVTGDIPWLLSTYLGASVVCLAVAGSFGPRRRWTFFWWGAAVVGVVLALGANSPIFRAAFELLPPFRSVRYPEKFLLLTAIAIPALGAAGLESALEGRVRPPALALGAALVTLSGVGSWLWMDGSVRGRPSISVLAAAIALGGTLALLVGLARGRIAADSGAALLCALTALDLGWTARAVNPSVPWRFSTERPWAARVLDARPEDRLGYRVRTSPLAADMEQVAVVERARFFSNHWFFQQSMAPNLGQLYGFLQQDGMAGIESRATADQIDALVAQDVPGALRLLRLQSVRYLVTSFPLPPGEVTRVAQHPELPIAVVRLEQALPRAYLAGRWRVAREPTDALRGALAPDFVPGVDVVLDREPFDQAPPAPAASAAAPGTLRRVLWSPSASAFELELTRPAVLVVTDTYFPGWRADVDGRSATILRANGYQQAVALPAGRHRVDLAYRPASLAQGARVSGIAALLLAVAGWWTRPGRRRTPATLRPAAKPGGEEWPGAPSSRETSDAGCGDAHHPTMEEPETVAAGARARSESSRKSGFPP
jgi:hypothetical protein